MSSTVEHTVYTMIIYDKSRKVNIEIDQNQEKSLILKRAVEQKGINGMKLFLRAYINKKKHLYIDLKSEVMPKKW